MRRTGRTRQKARTRAALLDAARELLAQGRTPSVEEAAEAADVSRATAYRYFPNQRVLLVAAHPEIEAVSLLGEDPPADPRERLDRTIAGADPAHDRHRARAPGDAQAVAGARPAGGTRAATGARHRMARGGTRSAEDRLSPAALRRLVLAIRSACGIEALVWLTDVAGLSRGEAAELMRWSALALLSAALTEGDAP